MTRGRWIGPNRRAQGIALGFAFLTLPSLLCSSDVSQAIQLRWSTGAMDMSFSSATRCTLVVEADSSEGRLPPEWRLLWAADSSCTIVPLALDEEAACAEDIAQIAELDPPASAADSAAHQATAHFCSAGSEAAAIAYFMLELPAGSSGKFKVVALDPADPESSRVLESPDVTFNGGVDAAYPPVLLHATSSRQGTQFTVQAIGAGLKAARSATIGVPDGRWKITLNIAEQSDSTLTAGAEIAANVPACVLQATDGVVMVSTTLAATDTFGVDSPEWVPSLMQEAFTSAERESLTSNPPNTRIQPKDFAFLFAQHKFHLFYIRLNQWDTLYTRHGSSDSTEKNFGHARSWDLNSWKWAVPPATQPIDTTTLEVRSGAWDNFHVWAPSIVQQDSTYFMFYTGVTDTVLPDLTHRYHQRIGVATSTDLDNWDRYSSPILKAENVPWADKNPPRPYLGTQQLRDPFVMPDPDHAGHWLMYFVAVDSSHTPKMAVGVAKSDGDLFVWTAEKDPLRNTDADHLSAYRIESPHVFGHDKYWWLCFSPADSADIGLPYVPVAFQMDSVGGPADTVVTNWSRTDTLYNYQGHDPRLEYWHASEYFTIGGHEFLAAYDDFNQGIAIGELNWYGPHDFVVGSASVATLAVSGGPDPYGAQLFLSGAQPARVSLAMRVELPGAMRAQVAVYDVAGRRMKTVLDRDLPAGQTAVSWDGRDASGARAASGVYFARLTCRAGNRVVKAVWLR